MPPGCRLDLRDGLGRGRARARAPRGGRVGLVERRRASRPSTSSPPIVHSSAAPPARPKNERRVVRDLRHDGGRSETTYSVQVRTYWVRFGTCPRHRLRAEASERVRDAIVAATVRIVAREGVAAVTHRRVAAEAGVALSSTTWHFATKADILEAALRWTAEQRGRRASARSPTASAATEFDPAAWAEELADWLIEQVTEPSARSPSRSTGCRSSCSTRRRRARCTASGASGCRRWASVRSEQAATRDARSSTSAWSSPRSTALRLSVLSAGEHEVEWLRPAVDRQLHALLG